MFEHEIDKGSVVPITLRWEPVAMKVSSQLREHSRRPRRRSEVTEPSGDLLRHRVSLD